jgi:hypothetical protein
LKSKSNATKRPLNDSDQNTQPSDVEDAEGERNVKKSKTQTKGKSQAPISNYFDMKSRQKQPDVEDNKNRKTEGNRKPIRA